MIKVSSKVDPQVWEALREMARDSQRSIAGLLTEAIREYLARRRVRPVVLEHLEASIRAQGGSRGSRGPRGSRGR